MATFFLAKSNQPSNFGKHQVWASTHGKVILIADEKLNEKLTDETIIKVVYDLVEDDSVTLAVINPFKKGAYV